MATTTHRNLTLLERFARNVESIRKHIQRCDNRLSTTKGRNHASQEHICVAISGGSDSTALLALASQYVGPEKVLALTFDHQLRPESSQEAQSVSRFAASLGIPHHTIQWQHHKTTGNIQHRAREARYNAISLFCKANGIKIAMTGHTIDDQIETYIMRKNHGSSQYGLACMSATRPLIQDIYLARPLLNITRTDLRNFLQNQNITWSEDPSNQNSFFERVRTRQYLQQLYQQKEYHQVTQEMITQISRYAHKRIAIEKHATNWLSGNANVGDDTISFITNSFLSTDNTLNCENFKALQSELLHRMLQHITCNNKRLTHQQIDNIIRSIHNHATCSIAHCIIQARQRDTIIKLEQKRHNYVDKTCIYQTHRHQYCLCNNKHLYIPSTINSSLSVSHVSMYTENHDVTLPSIHENAAFNPYHIFSTLDDNDSDFAPTNNCDIMR